LPKGFEVQKPDADGTSSFPVFRQRGYKRLSFAIARSAFLNQEADLALLGFWRGH
jgi:hypothetical protein